MDVIASLPMGMDVYLRLRFVPLPLVVMKLLPMCLSLVAVMGALRPLGVSKSESRSV